MQPEQEQRARKLIEYLDGEKQFRGFIVGGGMVVLRASGAPYTDTPTMYDENDLNNAVALGLIEKRKVTGSLEWEWYTLK
jgi:hypothetical protein